MRGNMGEEKCSENRSPNKPNESAVAETPKQSFGSPILANPAWRVKEPAKSAPLERKRAAQPSGLRWAEEMTGGATILFPGVAVKFILAPDQEVLEVERSKYNNDQRYSADNRHGAEHLYV
jgi:hypothetical protein